MKKILFIILILFLTLFLLSIFFKEIRTADKTDLIGSTFESNDYKIEIEENEMSISLKRKDDIDSIYLKKKFEPNINGETNEELFLNGIEEENVKYPIIKIETEGNIYKITLKDSYLEFYKHNNNVILSPNGDWFFNMSN